MIQDDFRVRLIEHLAEAERLYTYALTESVKHDVRIEHYLSRQDTARSNEDEVRIASYEELMTSSGRDQFIFNQVQKALKAYSVVITEQLKYWPS